MSRSDAFSIRRAARAAAMRVGAASAVLLFDLAGPRLLAEPAGRAYLALVGLEALILLARAVAASHRPEPNPAVGAWWRRGAARLERPRQLEELERSLEFSSTSAFDLHYRLRRHLAEIAAGRLAAHRGISLARDSAAARAVMDEQLWELVRPERPDPLDRHAPGMSLQGLARLVEALEQV